MVCAQLTPAIVWGALYLDRSLQFACVFTGLFPWASCTDKAFGFRGPLIQAGFTSGLLVIFCKTFSSQVPFTSSRYTSSCLGVL